MGSYLNPGYKMFLKLTAGAKFVDKTLLIDKTNQWMNGRKSLICMSRPRRFGKTIASTMLAAYYSRGCDSEWIFKDRKIASYEGYKENLNSWDLIYIDVGGEYSNTDKAKRADFVRIITDKVLREMRISFPDIVFDKSDTLGEALRKVYIERGTQFVIILDEYDDLVREKVNKELLEDYLQFLNGMFKSQPVLEAISLAYLTGILPIVKDKVQSKLNNFKSQYTFLNAYQLAPFMGFTSDEVMEICEENNLDFKECQRWYNGYSQNGMELYNPESIMIAAETGDFDNYWSQTSTFQVISDRLIANFQGMKEDVVTMVAGGVVKLDASSYLNTAADFFGKDEVFTYLVHLGYLAYDKDKRECRIPNREIQLEWIRAIRDNDQYAVTNEIIQESEKLLNDTLSLNEEAVAKALDKSHIHATSNRSYNSEDGLQCAIYLAYIYALNEYNVVRECSAGKGIADMVYIPVNLENSERSAMIIELKHKQLKHNSADKAMEQIRNKQYFAALEHYKGRLLFVGINYDEKEKSHSCKIEQFIK